MDYHAMKKRRSEIDDELAELIKKVEAEKRDLTPDEARQSDKLINELEKINAKLKTEAVTVLVRERGRIKEITVPSGRRTTPTVPCSPTEDDDDDLWSDNPFRSTGDDGITTFRSARGTELTGFNGRTTIVEHRGWQNRALAQPDALGRIILAGATGDANHLGSDLQKEVRDLSGVVNHGGGFLVPEITSLSFIDLNRQRTALGRLGATFVPIGGGDTKMARQATAATVSVHGENVAETRTDITFDAVTLSPYTLMVLIRFSEEWAQDAANAAQVLSNAIVKDMANEVDRQCLAGTGSDEMLGLLNMTGINTASGTPVWTDLTTAITNCRVDGFEPTGWISGAANAEALDVLLINSEANHYLSGPPGDIPNLTKVVTEQIGTADILVGDFSKAIVGVRQDIRVDISKDSSFDRNAWDVRVTWRGDTAADDVRAFSSITGL